MNFIINFINKIIIIINRLIDGLDRKTVDTIRSSYYGLIVVLIILGIFIGYNRGKGSAKKYGKPLTESTNEIFEGMINKGRSKERYRSMLESELIEEKKELQLKKVDFPANEIMKAEIDNKIIEGDSERTRGSSLTMDNPQVAEVERTDERMKKPDVRELKREDSKIRLRNKSGKTNQPIDAGTKIIEK
jgi:hypothetical protein